MRETMATLVAELRELVGDRDAPQHFTDDQLERFLDRRRTFVQALELAGVRDAPNASTYSAFVSVFDAWEGGAALYTSNGGALTASEEDLLAGRWTFSPGRQLGVYVTGRTYDLQGAAADALEAWAAAVARQVSFTADGAQVSRSDRHSHLLESAKRARALARPATLEAIRSDTA